MVQVLKMTKKQVEADLEERSASISNRLEAIESDLPIAPKRIRGLLGKKALVSVGIIVVVSVVTGALVFRFRKDPGKAFREELDSVSAAIGKEIRKYMNRGLGADEAVSKALNKRPPVVHVGSDGGSLFAGVVSTLSRHIASAVGPVIAEKIADRLRGESDEK